MKLEISRNRLRITPEDGGLYGRDERDEAYICEVLGLKRANDYILLRRVAPIGLSNSLAYLETCTMDELLKDKAKENKDVELRGAEI